MAVKNPRNEQAIKKLGQNVRKQRTLKGLSMVKLSELCNVDYRTISNIELGAANTTVSMVAIIAKALAIHPSVLFED
ncbi:MAG: helix-turn-helix transcriptional regulator [Pedobacter sp.]|uniref:helix-turn-helix domain-containing protein n=1 Tax=Pedobacter sp. TaxID=1411316 RepID=UPI00356A81B5